MKFFLQILFLFLTWFTNLNATPVFTKAALPSYEVSFSKWENVKAKWGDDGIKTLAFINNLGLYFSGAYIGKSAISYLKTTAETRAIQETFTAMRQDAEIDRRFAQVADAADDAEKAALTQI
jgi:hypothetical protein